jgi:hypothetical protein
MKFQQPKHKIETTDRNHSQINQRNEPSNVPQSTFTVILASKIFLKEIRPKYFYLFYILNTCSAHLKIFNLLYSFFWMIPRRLKFMSRRFGTLCSIFIGLVNKKNFNLVTL